MILCIRLFNGAGEDIGRSTRRLALILGANINHYLVSAHSLDYRADLPIARA